MSHVLGHYVTEVSHCRIRLRDVNECFQIVLGYPFYSHCFLPFFCKLVGFEGMRVCVCVCVCVCV